MHRDNNGRNPYFRSGVPGHMTPGGKKRSNAPAIVRLVIIGLVVIALIVAVGYGLVSFFGQSGKPIRINASPGDVIRPFGKDVVYYDGMSLYCVNASGGSRWQYSLGTGGSFWCSDSMVAAWAGNQLVILNSEGKPIYTDRMEETIRFVRAGESYVAACYGEDEINTKVRVMTHAGAILSTNEFPSLYLLDAGFFSTRGHLMWVLGLDTAGNAPMANLSTYEPGKMDTGAVEIPDELAYYVYVHNNNLMVVDTSKIRTYNYKCVEQTDTAPVLVYGWQVEQVRSIGRNTYALLEQMPAAGDVPMFSEVRLITNQSMKAMRFLTPCFASGLNDKGVYGFSSNIVYYAPYGQTTFKSTGLTFTLTGYVCMLEGNRAVVTSGNEVYIMQLPT